MVRYRLPLWRLWLNLDIAVVDERALNMRLCQQKSSVDGPLSLIFAPTKIYTSRHTPHKISHTAGRANKSNSNHLAATFAARYLGQSALKLSTCAMPTLLLRAIMPIWALPPVSSEPCIRLLEWRIFLILPQDTRHFVGLDASDRTGRVSSAVETFDVEAAQGTTQSGRVYTLVGESGYADEARYVWDRWCRVNGVSESVDVTDKVNTWART